MKEIQISNITQKISLIERQTGKYKLSIQSENNEPFRVCVNTEKYFDNNSPSYKSANDGFINIDIDADKSEVYELMILTDNEKLTTVRYNLQPFDAKLENEENNKKIHDIRKQQLTDIANYAVNLDEKSRVILNEQLSVITLLYKDKYFEDADNKLHFLHELINTNLSNVLDYLAYIDKETHPEKYQETKVDNKINLFSLSTLNIIIICLVLFFLVVFLIMKFTNKSISPKHIFSIN